VPDTLFLMHKVIYSSRETYRRTVVHPLAGVYLL
jgi:hypothetical protein